MRLAAAHCGKPWAYRVALLDIAAAPPLILQSREIKAGFRGVASSFYKHTTERQSRPE